MDELVSVVITTYGRKFNIILRSINSVRKQSYRNIEIILVDDNDEKSIFRKDIKTNIKKYKDIVYIEHKKNLGAQISRNEGIKNSKGKYIAFLDDDDEWFPEKLKKQINVLDDKTGLVYSKGYTIVEETKKKTKYVTSNNFKKEVCFSELLYADYIGTTSQALIPKIVFDSVGDFDINQQARQDYEMWIRISKKFKCVGVDEFLFNHYIHNGEQISKNIDKALKGIKNIYYKYRKDYKNYPLAKFHVLINISKLYKKQRKWYKMILYLFNACLIFPKVIVYDYKKLHYVFCEHRRKNEIEL